MKSSVDDSSPKTISLIVEIPHPRDLYQGYARMDYDSMDALGISTGSIVEVIGSKTTVARVMPLYPSDDGKSLIRIDNLTRKNAGATGSKSVKLRKTFAILAKDITVTPLNKVPTGTENYLRDSLDGQPFTRGQMIMVRYFRQWLEYKVVDHTPSCDAVLATGKTKFHITNLGKSV
ncbi:MAG: hypothetical protein ACREBI_02865 [Nitrosotalea sp.]